MYEILFKLIYWFIYTNLIELSRFRTDFNNSMGIVESYDGCCGCCVTFAAGPGDGSVAPVVVAAAVVIGV